MLLSEEPEKEAFNPQYRDVVYQIWMQQFMQETKHYVFTTEKSVWTFSIVCSKKSKRKLLNIVKLPVTIVLQEKASYVIQVPCISTQTIVQGLYNILFKNFRKGEKDIENCWEPM